MPQLRTPTFGQAGGLMAATTPPSAPAPFMDTTSAAPPNAMAPTFGPSSPNWAGGLFAQPTGTPQNPTTPTFGGVSGNPATATPSPAAPGYQPLPYTPIVPSPVPQNNEPQVPEGPQTGTTPFGQGIESTVGGLLNTAGAVNQGVINSQIDQARGVLNQQRSAQLDQDRAELADRGLLGSGAEGNALGTLDKNLGASYGSALSGILGNEYQAANNRMMQALTTGAGMGEQDAQRLVDAYNAQTGRAGTLGELGLQGQAIGLQGELGNKGLDIQNTLGNKQIDTTSQLGNRGLDIQDELGNKGLTMSDLLGQGDLALRKELGEGQLGLGEQGLNEDYSKFLGNLGLSRDSLAAQINAAQNGDMTGLLGILQGLFTGSSNGHF